MASFAQTLRTFQKGGITREGLLAEIEQILASDRADGAWLLSVLEKEQGDEPLPADIHELLKQRIADAAGEKPRAQEDLDPSIFIDKDVSRTQLATGFIGREATGHDAPPEAPAETAVTTRDAGIANEQIPIKGTGDTLNGRFVLEERLGAGGMSTVYRAVDRRKLEAHDRDPYVAVKVLNVEFRAHPDSLIALQREAKKCQRLAHPNIVRVYDFDRDGSTVYMTMEYLPGKSLAQTLRNPAFKGMSCDEAAPIVAGMGAALSFAHHNGIVHADFKPANVILADSGEVKVIDFGIARAFHKPGDADMEATRFDPGSLGALTPTYASPEMLEHREPDPRDDVYALACITYELLTGRHPFGRRQATEARDGGLALERRTLSRRQWRALRAALRFDRDRRTPTVEAFIEEIKPRCAPRLSSKMILIPAGLALAGLAGLVVMNQLSRSVPATGPKVTQTAPSAGVAAKATPAAEAPPPTVPAKSAESSTPAKPAPVETVAADKAANVAKAAPPPVLSLAAITPVLDAFKCAALDATVKGGNVSVQGFVEGGALDAMKKKLMSVPGVTGVDADVRPLTDGMCNVVDLFRPYWRLNRDKGYNTSIRTVNASGTLVAGEPLVVRLTTPPFESYINVDYYALDGHVIHMLPSPRAKGNQAPANYQATLGDLKQWVIGAPFGTEMVAMYAAPQPLFDQLRAETEPTGSYLNVLKQRLDALDADQRAKVTADFVLINTRGK